MTATPLARTIILTDASTVAFSSALAVYDGTGAPTPTPTPTPAPTPAPTFEVPPSISSDGSPQVGEVAAFSFGTIVNGVAGAKRLYKDGVDYADAAAGSIKWSEPGSYVLRVRDSTGAVFADSPAVVVVAVQAVATAAPTIAFASTNDDGSPYAAGTNPPIIELTIPETLDKTLYRAILYYDRQDSGPMSIDAARSAKIEDLMAAAETEEMRFAALGNLAAGAFRATAVFQNKSDSTLGPFSGPIATTLSAMQLPPASTVWSSDASLKSPYLTLSNGDRTAFGRTDIGEASWQCVAASSMRSDRRYFELELTEQSGAGGSGCTWGGGLMGSSDTVPAYGLPTTPADYSYRLLATVPAGTRLLLVVYPASAEGTPDGVLEVWRDGAKVAEKTHPYATYRPYSLTDKNTKITFCAGQEAFANASVIANLQTFKRYN